DEEQRAYLPAALVILGIAVAVQAAILLTFQEFWADFFFGSSRFVDLVPALALLVAGNGVFAVAYGNFRGHLRILHANILRVVVTIGMFAVAAFPVGFVLLPVASRLIASGSVGELRAQVFGVARVVGALIVAGLLVFEVFAYQIVTLYLGPAFAGSVSTLRVLMLGALPWALYI